jgi:hypothetical protein
MRAKVNYTDIEIAVILAGENNGIGALWKVQ